MQSYMKPGFGAPLTAANTEEELRRGHRIRTANEEK